MRRFAWTRILAVLLVLCMVASVVSMGVPAALAERVTIGSDTLEYFPVTLYNYDAEKMNQATHKVEYDANSAITEWNGLYFSGGNPAASYHPFATGNQTTGKAYQLVELEFDDDGNVTNLDSSKKYIFVNVRGSQAIYDNNSAYGTNFQRTAVSVVGAATMDYVDNATEWTAVKVTSSYTSTTATYNTLWSSGGGSSNKTWYETDYYYLVGGTYEKVYIYRTSNNGTYTAAYGTSHTTIATGSKNNSAGTFYILNGGSSTTGFQLISDRSSTTNYYMYIANGSGYSTTTATTTTIKQHSAYSECVSLSQGSYYLNHYSGNQGSTFAGYTAENSNADAFYIYEVVDNLVVDEYLSLPYADHNWWGKDGLGDHNDNRYGQMIYSGLVASQLDANKDIVFNVPDAGLFSDAAVDGKTIYTGAQIPFVYDDDTKYYTFDSAIHGVYWHTDSTQGTSSTVASNTKLYWDKGNPQEFTDGITFGDGSENLWAPFNDGDPSSSSVDYYFGMNATVPFTMTANGRLNASNNESDPIEFSFSGDDDVWIFIDGTLVADLGGIHNRLDVTINFATNEVTYFISDDNTAKYNNALLPISDGNGYDADDNTTGNLFTAANGFTTKSDIDGSNGLDGYTTKLFNEGETTGLLKTDLTSFAAKDNHELTIFYMERGGGSSNARIKFNLPVKDTVSVKKVVDEELKIENGVEIREELSAEYQAVVNNLDFEFIMMKNGVPLANTTYNLLNANGQIIANPSTDANGKFTLKNGQTAKFTGEFTSETSGDTYQVYETIKDGFIYTEYTATISQSTTLAEDSNALTTDKHTYYTAGELYTVTNKTYNGGAEGMLYSTAYTVYGTGDTEDSLSFVCENLLNASLPTPSAIPNDDKFVLDFGLSAELEIFSNDLFIDDGSSEPIISFASYNGEYGTFTYADGKITYTLNKQMTGVEVIPYTLTVTAQGNNGGTYTATGTANIYIIPATTMYYEENFSGLVTTNPNGASWNSVGTPETDKQEPGKVGTSDDSPYGSDKAYLNDSGDSNGSSMHVDTSDGAAQFTYTFTGTGTSFFARTSNNTAYLRIRVYDVAANKTVYASYLDTVYKTDDTLYNVPVFTWNAVDAGLGYGEYTVEVTVAKKTLANDGTTVLYHSDFWLDGIRVFEPLNPEDANYDEAETAYNRDAEANMTVVTLRDKILGDSDYDADGNLVYSGDNFVTFTDVNGRITSVEEYQSIGPKEEVYLMTNQTVSFSLVDWDPNTYHIYLGIKAPTGNGTVEIGSTQLTIKNAADCYYDISAYGTVTEETIDSETVKVVTFDISSINGLISLTNIKVTGDVQFIVIPGNDEYYEGSSGQNP